MKLTVGGADGCPGGWLVGTERRAGGASLQLVRDSGALLSLDLDLLAVDIPIGLLEEVVPGGRPCDREARRLLRRKGSSVFSAAARPALQLIGWDDPRRPAFGLTRQAWNIVPRIGGLDSLISPERIWAAASRGSLRPLIVEVHPEVSFALLNGGSAVMASKRRAAGRHERAMLLARQFEGLDELIAARPPAG